VVAVSPREAVHAACGRRRGSRATLRNFFQALTARQVAGGL
jgi:hypothetical protein